MYVVPWHHPKPPLYRTLPIACLHAPEGCTMHQMLNPIGAEAVLPLLQQNQHEINGKAIEAKAAVPKTSGNGLVPANRKMFVGGTVSLRAERSGQRSRILVLDKRDQGHTPSAPAGHAQLHPPPQNASISADCTCRQCCWQRLQLRPTKRFVDGAAGSGNHLLGIGRDGPSRDQSSKW